MKASNPYTTVNPVHGPEQFIGRTELLRDIEQTLHKPETHAIALFGQRRIGKTSILLHIKQELNAGNELTPIYFNLQNKASLPLEEVLYQMSQKISVVTEINLPELEQFDKEGKFFHDTFIPAAVKNTPNQGLVLLLDEFDVLDQPKQEQAGTTFFHYLRKWMGGVERMRFIFALGRRPEELDTDMLSTFKAIPYHRIGLMSLEETEAIIRQAENDHRLTWTAEGVQRVWHWSQGHPFLSQILCTEIWKSIVAGSGQNDVRGSQKSAEASDHPPVITAETVDAAIDTTIEHSNTQFQWIWKGLPAAERVVMAGMAEVEEESVTREDLVVILNFHGMQLTQKKLERALKTLCDWDVLRQTEGGLQFAIPLLHEWVREERPLHRIKTELKRLEPVAETLYQAVRGFYKTGNLEGAEQQLRRALAVNPKHLRARLLLGPVLVGLDDPAAAVEEVDVAYQIDPRLSKSVMIGTLTALARKQPESQRITTYDRVLKIDPKQTAVREKLQDMAEHSVKKGHLTRAFRIYQHLGDQEYIDRASAVWRRRSVDKQLVRIRKYEKTQNWSAVMALYAELIAEFPAEGDWQAKLEETQKLARAFSQAAIAPGNEKTREKTIAVIEDSHFARALLANKLRKHGFNVLVAGDAETGHLQIVQKMPDLIVLDLNLPHLEGGDFAVMLKETKATAHIPIIIFSVSPEEEIKQVVELAGADDYVRKSENMKACVTQLIKKIQALIVG